MITRGHSPLVGAPPTDTEDEDHGAKAPYQCIIDRGVVIRYRNDIHRRSEGK